MPFGGLSFCVTTLIIFRDLVCISERPFHTPWIFQDFNKGFYRHNLDLMLVFILFWKYFAGWTYWKWKSVLFSRPSPTASISLWILPENRMVPFYLLSLLPHFILEVERSQLALWTFCLGAILSMPTSVSVSFLPSVSLQVTVLPIVLSLQLL